MPAVDNQLPVPTAAAVATRAARKVDDVAAAQKTNSNVGANALPKKSTPAPRKPDVSKTPNINKNS